MNQTKIRYNDQPQLERDTKEPIFNTRCIHMPQFNHQFQPLYVL